MTTKRIDTPNIKLIAELNKLKAQVPSDVEAGIDERIKVISQKGYTLPHDEDTAEMAGRIIKEVETVVKDREIFAACEDMGYGDLTLEWQSNPVIQKEYPDKWAFIHYIVKIFPNSPARELARKDRPADYPQEQAGEQKNAGKIKAEIKTKTEHSLPLGWAQWADIFAVSENTLRKYKKDRIYHFRKVKNGRRWTLPKSEIPCEYLEQYRSKTT